MSPWAWLLALAFVPLAALSASIGIGGGAFFVPIWIAAGYSFLEATAISLAMITAMGASAAWIYLRSRLVELRLLALFGPAGALGALGASLVADDIGERSLRLLFALVLLPTAWRMATTPRPRALAPLPATSPAAICGGTGATSWSVPLLPGFVAGAATGVLSGLLGIGGGLVLVPTMTLVFGVPMRTAVATSGVLIACTAFFGATGHALAGNLPLGPTLLGSAAVIVGGQVGARWTLRADPGALKRLFAVTLAVLGLWIGAGALV